MIRKKRSLPTINTSSMADLAFTLLFYFLVAATIETDAGIMRLLPPSEPVQKTEPPRVKECNVFIVELLPTGMKVGNKILTTSQIQKQCIEFIENTDSNPLFSEKSYQYVPILGKQMVSKAIVYVKIDRQASYQSYIALQNTLTEIYTQLRQTAAVRHFGLPMQKLSKAQLEALKKLVPQRITETEL